MFDKLYFYGLFIVITGCYASSTLIQAVVPIVWLQWAIALSFSFWWGLHVGETIYELRQNRK